MYILNIFTDDMPNIARLLGSTSDCSNFYYIYIYSDWYCINIDQMLMTPGRHRPGISQSSLQSWCLKLFHDNIWQPNMVLIYVTFTWYTCHQGEISRRCRSTDIELTHLLSQTAALEGHRIDIDPLWTGSHRYGYRPDNNPTSLPIWDKSGYHYNSAHMPVSYFLLRDPKRRGHKWLFVYSIKTFCSSSGIRVDIKLH